MNLCFLYLTVMCVPVFDTSVGAPERAAEDRHTPKERTKEKSKAAKAAAKIGRRAEPLASARFFFAAPFFVLFALFSVYGTFGAFAIVSGDASPKHTPSCQTLKSPATSNRISRSSVPSILHNTSFPSMSLSMKRYKPFE